MSVSLEIEKLKTTILDETEKARAELGEKLEDAETKDAGCIDKKTKMKGQWNPPGGGLFIDDQGKLEEWMEKKKTGQFGIHLGCAYQFFVEGRTTYRKHEERVDAFSVKVRELNEKLGTRFDVIVEMDGSALGYLTR